MLKMSHRFHNELNVAVLVAGPSQDEHDAQLHQAMLIEKGLTNLASVRIIGKTSYLIELRYPPFPS